MVTVPLREKLQHLVLRKVHVMFASDILVVLLLGYQYNVF